MNNMSNTEDSTNNNNAEDEVKSEQGEVEQDPEEFFKQQLNMINEFADTIRTRQLEKLFSMSETKEITLDNRTYHRKPLTAKQHRRLIELDQSVSNSTNNLEHEDLLIELRKAEGEYYFGIPPDVVDNHYEELEDVLDACLLKTYTGIKGSDINIPELLDQYRKRYDNSLNILKSL